MTFIERIIRFIDRYIFPLQPLFSCDTCERFAKRSEAITSDALPESLFCSATCRTEAETEAEYARYV